MAWTADIDEEYMEANILEDNSNIIATVFMDERTPKFAHLIATAPELLEVLKIIVTRYHEGEDIYGWIGAAGMVIDAAEGN